MHKEHTKTIDLNHLENFSKFGSFVLMGLFITILFVTSTSYTQLIIASTVYPLFVFLVYKVFPLRKNNTIVDSQVSTPKYVPVNVPEVLNSNNDNAQSPESIDIDKRTFLKLIGTAGVSFFLLSLFTRKAESVFFGRSFESGLVGIEDKDGKKISPAEKQPTDGYKISEIDTSDYTYYGFINKDGGWYIMREDPTSGSFRYIRGDNMFPNKWSSRENLNYDYFNVVFA